MNSGDRILIVYTITREWTESVGVICTLPVMHSAAQAVFEMFALFADSLLCPTSVSEGFKAVFPDIVEVVPVDIAL